MAIKVIIRGRKRFQAEICPFCVGSLAIAPSDSYDLHARIWHTEPELAKAERQHFNTALPKRPVGFNNREYEHGLWQDR